MCTHFWYWALSIDCCVTASNSIDETGSPFLCSIFYAVNWARVIPRVSVNKIYMSSHLISAHAVISCSHSVPFSFPAFPVAPFAILNHPWDIFMKLWSHKFTPAVTTTTPGMVLVNTTLAPIAPLLQTSTGCWTSTAFWRVSVSTWPLGQVINYTSKTLSACLLIFLCSYIICTDGDQQLVYSNGKCVITTLYDSYCTCWLLYFL